MMGRAYADFIRWLRRRPEFADLVDDMDPSVRSLRALVLDMEAAGACPEAQHMLLVAVRRYDCDNVPADTWEALTGWAHR